jgi:hypothetical protein
LIYFILQRNPQRKSEAGGENNLPIYCQSLLVSCREILGVSERKFKYSGGKQSAAGK